MAKLNFDVLDFLAKQVQKGSRESRVKLFQIVLDRLKAGCDIPKNVLITLLEATPPTFTEINKLEADALREIYSLYYYIDQDGNECGTQSFEGAIKQWQAILSKECSLSRISAHNDNERQQKVRKFEFKKQECIVLIVESTSPPKKWTIAGFDNAGRFKSVLIDDPNNALPLELKKKTPHESKIIKLAASILGRTLSKKQLGALNEVEKRCVVKEPDVLCDYMKKKIGRKLL